MIARQHYKNILLNPIFWFHNKVAILFLAYLLVLLAGWPCYFLLLNLTIGLAIDIVVLRISKVVIGLFK